MSRNVSASKFDSINKSMFNMWNNLELHEQ